MLRSGEKKHEQSDSPTGFPNKVEIQGEQTNPNCHQSSIIVVCTDGLLPTFWVNSYFSLSGYTVYATAHFFCPVGLCFSEVAAFSAIILLNKMFC